MKTESIKALLDACYQAKRIRELLPALPDGVSARPAAQVLNLPLAYCMSIQPNASLTKIGLAPPSPPRQALRSTSRSTCI